MILVLTGHRPDKLGGYEPCEMHVWLRERLRAQYELLKPTEIVLGMAQGWDTFGAEVAVKAPDRVSLCGRTPPFTSPDVRVGEKVGEVAAKLLTRTWENGAHVFEPCPTCFDLPGAK